MTALELTATACGISGIIHFSTRPAVIRMLHRMGLFESLGAPRIFFYSDTLPLRTVFLPFRNSADKTLAAVFLVSWISFLRFLVATIVPLLFGPQSA
jgi:hypothetical protein